MTKCGLQTLFSTKENRGFLKKWLIPTLKSRKCTRWAWYFILEGKETIKDFWGPVKRSPAAAAAAAASFQSCLTLCNPVDGSPPGSAIPGILQARTLEWVAISFSNAWKWKVKVKSLSRDPMDCNPPGSSVCGIFQARVLEWGAIVFSVTVYTYNKLLCCMPKTNIILYVNYIS